MDQDRHPATNPRVWLLAARPATLWAAVAPVVVGTALAVRDGAFRWDAAAVTLFAALCIQVGVNYANDLADAAKGADTEERIGPPRAVASGLVTPRQMRIGIAVAFGLAALAGLYLIRLGGWPILAVGVASIAAALGYTGGPAPYGYRGLGEVFVFVFFGLVATVGTRYVFDRTITVAAVVASIPMGLQASAILVANNIRDLPTDAAAGKRTLAVLLGRDRTRILFGSMLALSFSVILVGAAAGWLPPGGLLALLAAPLAVPLVRTVTREESGPPLIAVLEGTARLQIVVAGLLAVGSVI